MKKIPFYEVKDLHAFGAVLFIVAANAGYHQPPKLQGTKIETTLATQSDDHHEEGQNSEQLRPARAIAYVSATASRALSGQSISVIWPHA